MTAGRRSPVHLALAAWAAATVGELASPRAAGADAPTAEMRARLEDAFVDGRIAELESLAVPGEEPVSVEPVAVRDLFWRPVTGPRSWKDPREDLDRTGVSARRLAWLRAHAAARLRGDPGVAEPYPMPGAGEDDPYPRLTAWVLDRLLRETVGSDSIGTDGPLGALRDDELAEYWVRAFRRPAYAGPGGDGRSRRGGPGEGGRRARGRRARQGLGRRVRRRAGSRWGGCSSCSGARGSSLPRRRPTPREATAISVVVAPWSPSLAYSRLRPDPDRAGGLRHGPLGLRIRWWLRHRQAAVRRETVLNCDRSRVPRVPGFARKGIVG